jgi:tight adherence protein C
MDNFANFILSVSGDPVTGQWLVMFLFGASAFALVVAMYFLVFGVYNPVRARLYSLVGNNQEEGKFFRNATQHLGSYFVIRDRAGEQLSYDRERLLHAGYHDKNSLSRYYGIKIILTISLPILIFLICSTLFPKMNNTNLLVFVLFGLVIGFIAPSFYLDRKVEARKRIIQNAFPDTIDQLIVCTEAGLGLEASLQRVAKDASLSNEIMGNELGLVNAELRAGVSREQAFKNLVNRTGVEDIRVFATAITQSIRFGTSIGNTLRVFAEDLRDKRMQRAEEEAAKLAVKMLFPLVFCFFPGVMLVILGPAMISIYKVLLHK